MNARSSLSKSTFWMFGVSPFLHTALWCSFAAHPAFADEPALRERFLREAPLAWIELESLAFELKATVKVIDRDLDPKKVGEYREFDRELVYNGKAGNFLWEESSVGGVGAGNKEVIGINDEYAFRAKKSSEANALVVKDLDVANRTFASESKVLYSLLVRNAVKLPVMLHCVEAIQLVKGPAFTVTTASTLNKDGDELVQIAFTSRDRLENKYEYLSGRMAVDPSNRWAIRELVAMVKIGTGQGPGLRLSIKNEYEGNINGFPIPRRQRSEFSVADNLDATDGKIISSKSAEWTEVALGDVRLGDCTMEAFGLPKPPLPSDRNWLVWVNLLVLIIFIVLIAARNRWRVGRQSPQME